MQLERVLMQPTTVFLISNGHVVTTSSRARIAATEQPRTDEIILTCSTKTTSNEARENKQLIEQHVSTKHQSHQLKT
jgi:hypothetical protein